MTFHDLRAHFATTMNGLGVEKEVLEKLGGWASSKVLDAVYIRTPKQRVRDSLKLFDDYMYGVIHDTRTEKMMVQHNFSVHTKFTRKLPRDKNAEIQAVLLYLNSQPKQLR